MRFRKKPVEIEAIQFMGFEENGEECERFIGDDFESHIPSSNQLVIRTLEGDMIANRYDWIIKGVKGEFYPCKPDIFEETYEKVF